jgi:tetratricopeptide (TPR) repeat protein
VSVTPNSKTPGEESATHPVEEDSFGYKHPPKSTRFKKLQSGNPTGRPKGRRNFANLVNDALNQPVPVRSGKKTKNMPTCEAMLRVLVNKAGQGDGPALSLLLTALETAGRTTEVTDEEREKRSMKLNRPLTMEELDLDISEARERDRQRYLAMVESDNTVSEHTDDISIPLDVREGDKLVSNGSFDNALAAYRVELSRCKAQLNADKINEQVRHDFRRGVHRIGLLASRLLEAGEFQRAKDFADAAIAEAGSPFWVTPKNVFGNNSTNTTWIGVLRAHALMFLGHVDEARQYFLCFHSNKRVVLTSWETSFLQDFARFRELGFSHSLMADIEKRFATEGWTTKRENTIAFQKTIIRGEESVFIQTHPDDVRAGDLLAKRGELDEAVIVYHRNLDKCRTRLAKNPNSTECKQDLQASIAPLEQMARKFLLSGGFARALECADAAVTVAPHRNSLHAIRAQALMFLDRTAEAHKLFLEFRGKTIGRKLWEAAIIEDFEQQRKANRSRPLMDEIEKLFAEGGSLAQTTTNGTSPASGYAGSMAALIHSSDINSGRLLVEKGMLDEALAVFRRGLDDCKAKIEKFAMGQYSNRAIDDRTAIVDEIGKLAAGFLMNREFQKALDAVDCALSTLPSTLLNVHRAHALMFLDRGDEARPLYLRSRGARVDAKRTGEALILQEFVSLRDAELTCPLMDEIEKLFGVGNPSV